MKYLSLIAFLLVSIVGTSQDFSNLETPIPVNPDLKIGKLDNGLTYYIKKNAKPENKVELRLAVNAGSILETEEQLGLAHFMEHMNFNGTKNFQHNDLVDYLQSIGVKFGQHLNAYTSFDETVYMLPIPSDDPEKLEKGFDILEDWAFNCLLTPEEVEKERGVVLEELRLGLGANKRMLDRYLPLVMYKSHYADRLPIGKKEILENFKHEVLADFYKSWYRPNLMAVVVVGDIDVNEIEGKIKDHFGPYKNPENEKERKEYDVPDHDETFVAIESDPEASFTQVQLMYNDRGAPREYKTLGDYRYYMLEDLFATMINDRFQEIANGSEPPFTYGYSYHGGGWSRNKTAYQSFAMTSPDKQLVAFKTLVEENERVRRHGFIQPELDRAKKAMLANLEAMVANKDKTESRRLVGELIRNFLEDEFIPGVEWEYEASKALIDGIKVEEVNALINEFIHDDNRVVVFTSPSGENIPEYSKQQVLDVLEEVKTAKIEPYTEEALAASLMTEWPQKGSVAKTEQMDKLGMTKLTLSNGAIVFYKKTDYNDNQIMMRAYSPGGASQIKDHEEYKKIALAVDGLTEAGLNGFSITDMAKIQAGKEVSCYPYITDNYEGMQGTTVNKDVEDLFQLIYLNFTALNKNEDAYNSFVTKQVAFLGNLMNTPQYWFLNEKHKKVQKNNPRFMNAIPTAEDFAAQDYNKAYNFYLDRFADASDFTFFFIGSLDEAKIVEYSETYLASLPSLNRKEAMIPNDWERLKGTQLIELNKGTDPKATVEIQYRTKGEYNGKDAYYIKCAGEILTIKLIENLREGESGVYGVGARGSGTKYPEGAYSMTISFPCGPENVEKLKKAAMEEVQKMIDEGPTEKDLNKIKEAQKLELKENMKKNSYWIRQLHNMYYMGTDLNEFMDSEGKIDALTGEQIQDVMKKYITEDVIISILKPAEGE